MSSARVNAANKVRQLDRLAEPDAQVTEEQVQDPPRLARMVLSIMRELATLRRRWAPRSVVHEDREVDGTGTTIYRFPHGFAGRVDWWPVAWTGAAGACALVQDDSTDDNTLALVSYEAGTVTLRIEEAG